MGTPGWITPLTVLNFRLTIVPLTGAVDCGAFQHVAGGQEFFVERVQFGLHLIKLRGDLIGTRGLVGQ